MVLVRVASAQQTGPSIGPAQIEIVGNSRRKSMSYCYADRFFGRYTRGLFRTVRCYPSMPPNLAVTCIGPPPVLPLSV